MAKFKNKYRIESNRHPYADYSAPGGYFITICTQNRKCIFGSISNRIMKLSPYGDVVNREINRIPDYHDQVRIGSYVVMPDHVHLIVDIGHPQDDGRDVVEKIHEFSLQQPPPWWHDPNHQPTTDDIKQYRKQRRKMIIPKIIGKFKMITSKQINIIRQTPHIKNWQANYHDHIIKNDLSYQRIKRYIENNPLNWKEDQFNTYKEGQILE